MLVLFSAVTFLLLNSFVSVNLFDGVVAEPISVNESTPFPLTGKVTVYGAKGGHKQAVGEISYTATIEVKETERETYSIVTVRLNNLCKYDVSGYVYGIRNGQKTNFSKFEIAAENSWEETKTMSGKIDNIKVDVLILDLGIL
ncbi:MAG: hypothetical protein J6T88_10530 [Bacteroidales bacterium]|nr:hypothetical protein [Bacteroidales bacterium]